MRKYARLVAKRNLKKQGYTQVCKKMADGKSQFAKVWREFCDMGAVTKQKVKRKRLFNRLLGR